MLLILLVFLQIDAFANPVSGKRHLEVVAAAAVFFLWVTVDLLTLDICLLYPITALMLTTLLEHVVVHLAAPQL